MWFQKYKQVKDICKNEKLEKLWEFSFLIILGILLITLIIICILNKQLPISYKCVQSHTEEKERTICHRKPMWNYTCETEKYYEDICDKYVESKGE